MTKKEYFDKYKNNTNEKYLETKNCIFCNQVNQYMLYLDKAGEGYGSKYCDPVCEDCFVGKPLRCVICDVEVNEEDVWCNDCLGVDDDY